MDEWLEHAPVLAYLFRVVSGADGDEYVLVGFNQAVRREHPELETLVGHPLGRLYRDQPHIEAGAARCVRERVVVVEEATVRRYDRVGANQRLKITYVFRPPDTLVLFTEDVAPPSVVEAALRESEERYRAVLAAIPDGVVVRGPDGAVLAVNAAAVRLLGFRSEAEMLGRPSIYAPGYHVETEDGRRVAPEELPSFRALAGEVTPARILALRGADGVRTWLWVTVRPIRRDDGALEAVVLCLTDVSARIEAERALRAAAARLELALESARMGTWEWDISANTGWWSENLYKLFGATNLTPGFEHYLALVHPEDRAGMDAVRDALVGAAHGATFDHEHRLVGEDGVVRWARTTGRVFREGGRVRLSGTIIDITDRRRLEEELRQAQRLDSLGRLAGGVAHDFNNLLVAMLTSVGLLEEQAGPEMREDVATVRYAAERAADLTRQLLAFARRQMVELRVVDVNAMLGDVERMLRRLVGANIELVIEAATTRGRVRADQSQMEQVLVNMAVNARDAMPDGGRLVLRTEEVRVDSDGDVPAGEWVVISVCDNGSGMDEETRAHVFDPFYTTKDTGTGLGLASSYGIVKQHGGHVLVESARGRGSTFRVYLPRVSDEPAPLAPPPMLAARGAGVILVVDDEPLVRKAAERLLLRLGYQVLLAGDAAEALALFQANVARIDLVLCDVVMPRRSGPELARDLKALRSDVKILFVSGHAEESLRAAIGASPFLQKPYSNAELAERLQRLLAG